MYNNKPMKDESTFNLKLKNILGKAKKSSFIRNIIVVMTGTAASQVIGFAVAPIISRLFSPSDFGAFGSFNAVLAVIAAGVTLDYTQALMLPKQKEDAINLFMLSCISTVIITIFCLSLFILAPTFFYAILRTTSIWMAVFLIVAILVSGLNNAFQAWCVRVKAFKPTSTSQVIRSISSNGTQIGLGYLQGGALVLVGGVILGDTLASINLARILIRDFVEQRREITWNRIIKLANNYRDFPLYSASQNIVNALSAGLPVILLAKFYGIAIAGAYAFGMRIMRAPMRLVLVALRQVLFQRACETQNRGDSLLGLYIKTTSGLFALALLPSLILIIWAPQIFSWVFGSQWLTAGEYARFLILWLVFVFCNVPAVLFAKAIRIQRFVFLYNLLLLTLRALALVFGGLYLSALHTVILFALVGAAMNSFLILWVGYSVMKKEGEQIEEGFEVI